MLSQVEEIKNQLQKLQHAVDMSEKEKEEAVQMKKDVNEAAKNAQRDAAARIVDFSQKNSKLLAELTAARCEYVSLWIVNRCNSLSSILNSVPFLTGHTYTHIPLTQPKTQFSQTQKCSLVGRRGTRT